MIERYMMQSTVLDWRPIQPAATWPLMVFSIFLTSLDIIFLICCEKSFFISSSVKCSSTALVFAIDNKSQLSFCERVLSVNLIVRSYSLICSIKWFLLIILEYYSIFSATVFRPSIICFYYLLPSFSKFPSSLTCSLAIY